jgi:F420-dependent oxidoreductase-like protein
MIFGTFIPQGWKMELAGIADPQDKWAKALEIAMLAEDLGYDSLWAYDHVHNVPVPAHETMFECWTTLAAVSQRTSRIRLGQMVGCASYRNPALLAKITSNLDVMSGGRLDWGIGAGWYQNEYDAYGYEFLPARDRIRVLRETVEIVKLMWSEPDAGYEGRFFTIRGAQCDPKPLQRPHPPVWIGGGGEQLTLRVVARHATHSNFGGKPHEFAHKCEVLKGHCAAVGRDYDEITKTWSPEVFIREDEREIV